MTKNVRMQHSLHGFAADTKARRVRRRAGRSRALRHTLVALAFCAVSGVRPARAEETEWRGSGAIGGALLGAEATLLAEALGGVRPTWAYVLGALGGAALGGYVGHRIEQRTRPEISQAVLGAGILFVIPTAVWFGNLHAPRPPRAGSESRRPRHRAPPQTRRAGSVGG